MSVVLRDRTQWNEVLKDLVGGTNTKTRWFIVVRNVRFGLGAEQATLVQQLFSQLL